MELHPITRKQAQNFVNEHHRHHKAPIGDIFRIGLQKNGKIIGVIMVGRPVSRVLDNGKTLEVNRLCVLDGHKNACSFLYAAAAKVGKNLGYTHILTYILSTEPGSSLRAVGWHKEGTTKGRKWNCPSRPREQKSLFQELDKIRYGRNL